MASFLRPTWNLHPTFMPSRPYYGVVYRGHLVDRTVTSVWKCEHDHVTHLDALACAQAQIQVLDQERA